MSQIMLTLELTVLDLQADYYQQHGNSPTSTPAPA